jgi:hypothetical protein
MIPVFEESSGSACHIVIRGQLVGLETIADACPHGHRFRDKRPPVYTPLFECMPKGKQAPNFRQHPSWEAHAIGTPACMFESSEPSDDMSPADLSPPLVVCIVGREHIRTDNAVEDFSQDPSKHLCSPGGSQGEERHGGGYENPQPDSFPHALPARLVHIEDVLSGQSLFDFLTAWFEGLRDFLMEFAHRPQRDINSEKGPGELLTPSSGHPMHGGKIGQKSSKPGTETGSSLGWDIRPGDSSASTFKAAQLIFRDVRFDLGNLYHLAAKVIAEHTATVHLGMKGFVTDLTRLGKDILDQVNLLKRNQVPVCPLMTRLSSWLAMSRFLAAWNCRSASRAVRRRRLRGIGRIPGEQGNLALQLFDS